MCCVPLKKKHRDLCIILFSLLIRCMGMDVLHASEIPPDFVYAKKDESEKKKVKSVAKKKREKRVQKRKKSRQKEPGLKEYAKREEKKEISPQSLKKEEIQDVMDVSLPVNQTLSMLDRELGPKILKMNAFDQQRANTITSKDILAEGLTHKDLDMKDVSKIARHSGVPITTLESDGRSLVFKSAKPIGLALIKILDDYWLFCDRRYDFSVPKQLPFGLESINDESQDTSTIFKLRLVQGFWPIFFKKKGGWVLEFSKNPLMSRTRKVMEWSSSSQEPLKILMPNYVNEIAWTHPLTKIPYAIYTSHKEDGAFTPHEHFIQLDIMESYLGLCVRPKTQTLVAQKKAEDLYIFDAQGMVPPEEHPKKIPSSVFFFTDMRSPYALKRKLQDLAKSPESIENVYEKIRTTLSLGFFSEAGVLTTKLRQLCPQDDWWEPGRFDMMRLVLLTLSPHDETLDETLSFVNHVDQGEEFEFWYRLFKRIPQNYGDFIDLVLSRYPLFLKNKAVEILLNLPDEPGNLKSLLRLKGLHKDLKERARLKLSLMPPVDLRELEELSQYSLQRDVQARAKLQLLLEEQREFQEAQEKRQQALEKKAQESPSKSLETDSFHDVEEKKKRHEKRTQAIHDLEELLFSFGDQTFVAKNLLSTLYLEQRDYAKALNLLKDALQEEVGREKEIQEQMKRAFIGFFELLDEKNNQKTIQSTSSSLQPLEVVAFYNEFKHLMPEGLAGNKILQHVVDNLRALSLYKPALEMLNKSFEHDKDEGMKTEILFKSAALYIENNDFEGAEKTLKMLQGRDLSMEQKRHTRLLLSDAYLKQGQNDNALSALEEDDHLSVQLQREKIYWQSKNYKAIMALTPTVLALVQDKETKANLVTHLAFAEILEAPFDPPYEQLRERYQSDVTGTAVEDLFMKITTPDIRIMDGMRHFEELDRLLKGE